MDTDFIYCRHRSPAGIKIEEVSGGEGHSAPVWRAMAWQIYKENGKDGYRDVTHTESGAPLLYGGNERISASHAAGLLVVATLAPVPGADLEVYSPQTALGVDTEMADRGQVLRIRERFLSPAELASISADDVEANVLAWTVKEAVFKAALQPGLDLRDIAITELPEPAPDSDTRDARFGTATAPLVSGDTSFRLYSYRHGSHIVTLAWHPEAAVFV